MDTVDKADGYSRAAQELIALLYADTPLAAIEKRACELAREALDADCIFFGFAGNGTAHVDASACKGSVRDFDPNAALRAAVAKRGRVFSENGVASVTVPIHYGDTVFGALSAYDSHRARFQETDADALEAIGQYVALARNNHEVVHTLFNRLKWERRATWAIVVLALAASIALGLYGLFFSRTNADRVTVNSRIAADATSDHLDRYFSQALQLASTEAALAPQARGDRAATERLLFTLLGSTSADVIYGTGLWYRPYAFSPNVRLFGPYVHRTGSGHMAVTYLWSNPKYNYVMQAWYQRGLRAQQSVMTPPYFDVDHVYLSAVHDIRVGNSSAGVACFDTTSDAVDRFLARFSNPQHIHYLTTANARIVAFPYAAQLLQFARSRHPVRHILDVTNADAVAFIAQRYPGPRIVVQSRSSNIPVLMINAFTPSVIGSVPTPAVLLASIAGSVWLLALAAIFAIRRARARGIIALDLHREQSRLSMEIDTRVNAERMLRKAAETDALTGLANRVALLAAVGQSIVAAGDGARHDSLIYIDLNDFERINETFGYNAGDRLLVEFAGLLRRCARERDMPARLGGDEFAILVSGHKQAALALAETLYRQMATALILGDERVFLDAGIGVAEIVADYARPEDVIRDADFATNHAKRSERTTIVTFDPALRETASRQRTVQAALRGAVERDEILVEYQPIVRLPDSAVIGFEALMRWKRSNQQVVRPGDFIPLAERTGIILTLDRRVVELSCTQVAQWQAWQPDLHLAVNASALHFEHEEPLRELLAVLQRCRLQPNTLKVELTESALMGLGRDASAPVRELHALGMQLHLDDFGTGYSSLMYLQHLHVDALKVDRSFVSAMLEDERAMQIVNAIVTLARSLDVEVIAEGVEMQAQERALVDLGVTKAQGFLYSRPMPAQEAQQLLQNQRATQE